MADVSIKSVKQRFGKATGPLKKSDGSRVFTDEYVVIASTTDATGEHIAAATGIPQMFTPHPDHSGALVVDVFPENEGGVLWYVSVTWDTNHDDPDQDNDNPINDPIKWRWDVHYFTDTPPHDRNGKHYADVNGTPFNPPPKFRVPGMKLVIVRNEVSFDDTDMLTFADTCNKAEFWGHDAKTGRLDAPTATEEFAAGDSYWKVTYVILFKPIREVRDAAGNLVQDTWDIDRFVNQGPLVMEPQLDQDGNERSIGNDLLVAAKDEAGVSTGDIVLLDWNGRALPRDGRAPIMLEFTGLKIKDWIPLGIDIIPATPTN